ncbi:NlpC/P60 family protein [Actinoplanes aureus]|uniref:NlpC/P60 family protein n=1 Tax=Actinoplanes aureus TaxID=2792083 RepID=A0A931CL30_9ACTN|nr:NlpC/P60 family protein [Actinoplanes aureus]MBG0568233.1 NlpC/P60 family protein [Actinoplanes aureus]
MISRAIVGIAVAVAAVLLGCSGLLLGGGGGASANCLPAADASLTGSSASVSGGARAAPGPIGEWNAEQVANAAVIVAVGQRLQVPARGQVIVVATAMQESSLVNLAGGDRDSVGLFQQRPSQGWGTPAQLQDPQYAATKFYTKLLAVPGWQTMTLAQAAQAVQISAYPQAYAKWEPDAVQLVGAVGSALGLAIPFDLEQCLSTCVVITAADSGSCVDAATVFGRAQSWLTAWSDGPVPYLSSGDPADWFQGYRRDCSGYVSMALGLEGPGLNTSGLAARSTIISKSALRPGDLLINTAPNLRGHVVLFERWADASMTRYYGYEQTGSGDTQHRAIPYPYFGDYPMNPYRFGSA